MSFAGVLVRNSNRGVALHGDVHEISIQTGGTQTLTVNAGKAHANRSYWIFGSESGANPGVDVLGVHGEVLRVGTKVTIKWRIDIQHQQKGWNLWYSTTGAAGPWITIKIGMSPSQLSLVWTVPSANDRRSRTPSRRSERPPCSRGSAESAPAS